MGKTINATVLLSVVVKVNDGINVEDLLLRETEWLGEPRSPNGCIMAVNPKSCEVTNSRQAQKADINFLAPTVPEKEPEQASGISHLPIIKAAKLAPDARKWEKKYKKIKEALTRPDLDCIFMVQYEDGSIQFNVTRAALAGQFVCVAVKNNQLENINVE